MKVLEWPRKSLDMRCFWHDHLFLKLKTCNYDKYTKKKKSSLSFSRFLVTNLCRVVWGFLVKMCIIISLTAVEDNRGHIVCTTPAQSHVQVQIKSKAARGFRIQKTVRLFNYNNLIRTLYTFLMDLADLTKFYKPLSHIYLDYNYFITI